MARDNALQATSARTLQFQTDVETERDAVHAESQFTDAKRYRRGLRWQERRSRIDLGHDLAKDDPGVPGVVGEQVERIQLVVVRIAVVRDLEGSGAGIDCVANGLFAERRAAGFKR